jgi:hypothetical protein
VIAGTVRTTWEDAASVAPWLGHPPTVRPGAPQALRRATHPPSGGQADSRPARRELVLTGRLDAVTSPVIHRLLPLSPAPPDASRAASFPYAWRSATATFLPLFRTVGGDFLDGRRRPSSGRPSTLKSCRKYIGSTARAWYQNPESISSTYASGKCYLAYPAASCKTAALIYPNGISSSRHWCRFFHRETLRADPDIYVTDEGDHPDEES